MNDSIRVLVQGSEPSPYTLTFAKDGQNLTASCTCRAGEVGIYCKHRISVLTGDWRKVVGGDIGRLEEIRSWLNGSDVQSALDEVAEKERQLESVKKELKKAKAKLARVLAD